MSAGRPDRAVRVGVLALQGGVAEHARMLETLGADVALIRQERDLLGPDGPRVQAIVLPGGESSAQDRLLRLLDLVEPLRATIAAGIPTLGTCAGLILLARTVLDPAPGQQSLELLDVTVRRNAFGAQLVSAEAEFAVDAREVTGEGAGGAVRGALIRAPQIAALGPEARALATHQGRVIGATSAPRAGIASYGSGTASAAGAGMRPPLGLVTGISFHPELTGDAALHRALLAQAV